jgi:beta-barrel assembly-enhancing protease
MTPRGSRPAARTAILAAGLACAACIGEERELEIGAYMAGQINAQLPLVMDPLVNAHVSELGRTIAAHSERPHLVYSFYIVDTPTLNAFALPGGHIYLHRGLLERTRSHDELAGILAHEIAHVSSRHGVQNLQRQLRTRSMAATMYHLILNRRPLLDQEALDLGGALWHASHSRRAEVEADRMAVRYMVRSGHDPRGMLSLFGTLTDAERHEGAPPVSWFSTHPGTERRMEVTREAIREKAPRTRARGRDADGRAHGALLARLDELPRPMHLPLLLPPGAHPPP